MPRSSNTLLFLHGFASSAQGTKARYLRARCADLPTVAFHAIDFNPTPKDFEYLTVTGMINRLRQYVLDHKLENLKLIGSSLGGLVALNYAGRYGGVERMLLLAPALRYLAATRPDAEAWLGREQAVAYVPHYAFERPLPLRRDLAIDGRFYATPPRPPVPITIIHGRDDEVVPIHDSRRYATTYPEQVRLLEVEAGHGLNDHLPLIWEHVARFLLG